MLGFVLITYVIGVSSHYSMVKPNNWFDRLGWERHGKSYKLDYNGMSSGKQCSSRNEISAKEICKSKDCFKFRNPGAPCLWYTNYTFVKETQIFDKKLLTYPRVNFPEKLLKHPWRAPGSASVEDPCGVSGGNVNGCIGGCSTGGYSYGKKALEFIFKYRPQVTRWKRGSVAEVAWSIVANHGGGYSYRLCKIPNAGYQTITEECFQNTPLEFFGDEQWIQYGEKETTRIKIPAVRTKTGTFPKGSQWTKNPIPACVGEDGGYLNTNSSCPEGKQFPPPKRFLYGFGVNIYGHNKLFSWSIVDLVKIPKNLTPGAYVLSFRLDCEQTPQVWNSCASIFIDYD